MSMNVVVVSTDFRRATVKVSPSTYLIEVLETACGKLNLDRDRYHLKHKNKQLDLTNPIRTCNLAPGAKLELVVKSNSPTVVTVALKLPDSEAAGIPNGRLVEKFRSDTTLWKMLRHFESAAAPTGGSTRNLNITARGVPQMSAGAGAKTTSGSGQLYYEGPVLLVVGREISSLQDFQKTLSQLGISGNVLMHLSFKQTSSTLHESMQQIEQFFRDETEDKLAAPGSSAATTSGSAAVQPEVTMDGYPSMSEPRGDSEGAVPATLDGSPAQPTAPPQSQSSGGSKDVASTPDPPATTGPASQPTRAMQVFAAPTSSTPAAALTEEPDSTYQPTIAHAQLHQQRLLEKSHNKRLPSDKELAERAAAEEAKLAAVREVSIKVRFPDNTSAQWTFTPDDTAAALYAVVRDVMAHPAQPFKLISPAAARPELADSAAPAGHNLVHDYRLEGRVVVTLVWADSVPPGVRKAPFLKDSAARQARQMTVPLPPRAVSPVEEGEGSSKPPQKGSKSEGTGGGSGSGVKIPKWLKLPGKK